MLSPHCLWALTGLLVLLWIPRKPRVLSYPVGSLELWEKHFFHSAPRKLSRRDILLLLLQLLSYLCLVLAWAHPVQGEFRRKITIVLDRSASMQSGPFEHSSFDKAIAQTIFMLERLSSHDQVELHIIPPYKVYRESPRRLRAIVADLRPSQQRARFNPFFSDLARNAISPVYFISDGTEKITSPKVVQVCCGLEKTDNVGIVSFSIKNAKRDQRIFAVIENFSGQAVSSALTISVNDSPVYSQNLVLPPGQRQCWDRVLDLSKASTISLKLERADNFALDNEVYATKSPAVAVWIPPDPRDFHLLYESIFGICRAKDKKSARVKFVLHKGAWLIYTDSFDPNSMRINAPKNLPCTWTADPLLNAVCPDLIELPKVATLTTLPTGGKILLSTPVGPAAAYGPDWLFIGFSPEKSNWSDLPSFPIFWQNYFDYLAPERDSFCYVRTQSTHPRVGLFREDGKPLAVNLLSKKESDNRGSATREFKWPPESLATVFIDLRPYLVISAVLFLLLLWWYGR